MARPRTSRSSDPTRRRRPGLTPEAREGQLISAAVDLAEQQILDGTASSQVITHFLKLGSSKDRLEREILSEQKGLMIAKKEALQSTQRIEELYTNALAAMRNYGGHGNDEPE